MWRRPWWPSWRQSGVADSAGVPEKSLVAASFSRAAASYDRAAALQRRVVDRLLQTLPPAPASCCWLDLGSGTGYGSRQLATRYPAGTGLAVDIAEGMLRHARLLGGATHHLAGDAEALPLRDQCVDVLFSSLALQWCGDFARVLAEARRVLRPGGVLAFSSLCVGTLQELRDSWQTVDGYTHVNRFRPFETYRTLCADSGLVLRHLWRQPEVLHFADLRQLTHELKALGAHNLNPGRPDGLTGRARLRAFQDAYERFRQPAGLPATYQVVYGILGKE